MYIEKNSCASKPRKTSRKLALILWQICLKGICMIMLALTFLGFLNPSVMAATKSSVVTQASKNVVYEANLFDDGKARHFDYKTNDGVTIRYFIIKSSDGVIRAAFDTCVVCWRERKGYVQKDNTMVCTNCGRRFLSTKINDVTGGCNPAPLTRKVENGKVIIQTESLLQGKPLFKI